MTLWGKDYNAPGSQGSALAFSLVATISPPSILDFLAFYTRALAVISLIPLGFTAPLAQRQKPSVESYFLTFQQ